MGFYSFFRKWRTAGAVAADAPTQKILHALFWHRYRYPLSGLFRHSIHGPQETCSLRLRPPGAARVVNLIMRATDSGDVASLFENAIEFDISGLFSSAPSIVVDAGAHIGVFSLLVAARFPDCCIVAIEPDPGNVNLLRSNFAANQLKAEIVEAALWNRCGTVSFHVGASNAGYVSENECARQVRAITFTEVSALAPGNVDFVKLDIEGAELNVLPQVLPRVSLQCTIYLELHHAEHNRFQFLEILNRFGWRGKCVHRYPPHEMWLLRAR